MKQSIVALIRPNLNFSNKPTQAAHFIEHALLTKKRLDLMGMADEFFAKNVIMHNGWTNDFYMAEYFIGNSEATGDLARMIQSQKQELFLDKEDFVNIKSALKEELLEQNGEHISLDEQLSRAILTPDSPSVQNPWYDIKSLENLSYEAIQQIFSARNTDQSIAILDYDNFELRNKPQTIKNKLRNDVKIINILHPWLPDNGIQVLISIPLPEDTDQLTHVLYRRSLTDYRFGLLFNILRNKEGLIYDLSVVWNSANNTLEVTFFVSKEKYLASINFIKETLKSYEEYIAKNLLFIKKRLGMEYQLDWGDIQNQRIMVLDETILGNFTSSPRARLDALENIDTSALSYFNKTILESLDTQAVIAKSCFGKIPGVTYSDI